MKAYIAAPWVHRATAAEVAGVCESRGITVTRRWWLMDGGPEAYADEMFMRRCAIADFEGVRTADVLILLNTQRSEGKAVEQGLALAWGKPIFAVGSPTSAGTLNVFHYLAGYRWVSDVDALWPALASVR